MTRSPLKVKYCPGRPVKARVSPVRLSSAPMTTPRIALGVAVSTLRGLAATGAAAGARGAAAAGLGAGITTGSTGACASAGAASSTSANSARLTSPAAGLPARVPPLRRPTTAD
ncbi:hypothetical protein IP88_10155 [alpha proteobacterium AAP81b]|nr:hypothetical protein IP88_10155 [alpha proteobacterium AAP81b]